MATAVRGAWTTDSSAASECCCLLLQLLCTSLRRLLIRRGAASFIAADIHSSTRFYSLALTILQLSVFMLLLLLLLLLLLSNAEVALPCATYVVKLVSLEHKGAQSQVHSMFILAFLSISLGRCR